MITERIQGQRVLKKSRTVRTHLAQQVLCVLVEEESAQRWSEEDRQRCWQKNLTPDSMVQSQWWHQPEIKQATEEQMSLQMCVRVSVCVCVFCRGCKFVALIFCSSFFLMDISY